MSVPGPVRVIAPSDPRCWGSYGGKRLAPRPIQFTLDDHSGLCNEFFHLLSNFPANRLPRKVAERLLAWRIDTCSGCPECGNPVGYFIGPERQDYGWSPSSGFLINGLPSILPTSDRPKGVELRCDCGFRTQPWSLGGMRPRLRMALDLGFVEDVQSISQVSSEKRRDGSLRFGIRDDDGWYSLTEAGVSFIDAVDDGGDRAKQSIQSAISSYTQLSESVPKPEILTDGSAMNTILASLTEGPIFRDYALFLIDAENLDKNEDRLFLALYGQDFEKTCEECTLNEVIGCPMLEHLGNSASEKGCRPNLSLVLEQYRLGEIRWFDYELEVRGKKKSGFRGLETDSGAEISLMEWTHQVDKETSLLKFVAEGAGLIVAGSRSNPSYPLVSEDLIPMNESVESDGSFSDDSAWSPSKGLLFCMGLEGG